MKTSATILTEQMQTPDGRDSRDGNKGAIYALINDGDHVHCMTQGMIDAWWMSLSPTDKAEIHERWVDAELHLDMELSLAMLRNPLTHIYAAAQQLAADHRKPFTPDMPTFSKAELALLQRQTRRAN